MALGNSITQSNQDHYSYRYNLWKKLLDAGVEIDYVGSHSVQKNGNPDWPLYKGQAFDSDNEGHWGWSTDQILNGNSEETGKGRLSDWLTGYTPDIVLLHLGTNDMFRDQSLDETVNELKEVVQLIRADNPQVKIFFAKLIPAYDQKVGPQAANNIRLLNERIPALAQELNTAASPVILVDQYTGFNPTTGADTFDGIHPNASGEEKMAQKWFEAIMKVVQVTPVVYAAFEATVTADKDVQLNWETTEENNNDYFEVERALDNNIFTVIGKIDGSGSSKEKVTYNYKDTTAPYGILKYRLKQVSLDGSNSYSETVQVEKEQVLHSGTAREASADLLQVYPTISRDKTITVQLQDQQPFSKVWIAIVTANGQLVKQIVKQCSAEGTVTEKIRMPDSKAGLYLMQVKGSGESMRRRFILAQ
ncbi:GDSL-type esterase/lipase family protein [Pontibacter locisalis]|uniref:GDSL-type esterase/lipase family protein n=1 Tax=Pontibacter locisalis TaxID=1719035 RepID=A0ABW5IPD3_9BACT